MLQWIFIHRVCSQPQETATYSSFATGDSHIGCQSGRMGSSLSRPSSPGTMGIPITWSGFEYTGTQKTLPGTSDVCSIPESEEHPVTLGQQSSGSLHLETGEPGMVHF